MKKTILLIILALFTKNMFSQGSSCADATPFCTSVGTPFTYNNVTDGGTGSSCVSTTCPGVGCLGSTPRPSWFYLKSTAAGVMTFSLTQSSTAPGGTPNIDVDFIAYGPYTAAGFATACASGLTGTCTANHVCSGNMEDCSYSAASTETMTLTATAPGQYFLVMITNYDGTAGWITFTQTGGPGTDCSITCPSVTSGDGFTLSSGQPLPATLTCDAGTIPLYASDISPFGAPIVPGVMLNFTTNNNATNDINVYQSGFGYIGSLGPLTTGTNYDYQVYFLNPTSTYTFELCENNTAQPNMAYSILDLASGNTINFGTWVDDGACQSIVIPAGTITGSASFSASCGACVATAPNGTGSFNPSVAGAGTHTVTYTFAPGGACPTYTFSKVFTVLSPTVNTTMTSTTICEGASATLTLTGGYSQTFANTTTLTITDGSTVGVSSPITVSGIPGNAGSNLTSLTINVTHTYDYDLDLFLVCPNGYTIALSRANGGSGDNYTATTFSTSGTSIYAGSPPFTGTFRPEDPLWALSGCTSNGTWRLYARDNATPDQGKIISWNITFTDKNTYNWAPNTNLSATTGTNVVASPTTTTVYSVTASSNAGCVGAVKTITVNVNPKPTPSILSAPASSVCLGSAISFTAGTANTYTWSTGGTGGLSGTTGANVTATPTATGNVSYTVNMTSAAGCTNTATKIMTVNPVPVANAGSPATITCTSPTVTLSGSGGGSYTWTGPSITSGSNTATPSVTGAGTYSLAVTSAAGCTSTLSTVSVVQNTTPPAVTSSVSAVLNCTLTSVNVSASTAASPVSYNWSGTGITSASNISTITVNQPGTFNYTVTNTSNGCKTTGSQAVTQNNTPPSVASAATGVLNCTLTSVNVTATTAATPVTYTWSGTGITGGNGTGTITVNQPGTFNYTVTNTSNGCTTTGSQAVTQNTTAPATTSSVSAVLNCTLTSVNVSASTAASPVSYNWSGTGITSASNISTITVNQPGTFNYTVTNTGNGCTTTGSQAVTQNTTAPATTSSVSAVLNCTLTSVNVSASTAASPVSYNWSGTGITSASNISTITVNQPGAFNYTVTNTSNGCTTTGSQAVTQNITAPAVTASVSAVLSCTLTSVNVSASTAASPVSYNWNGTGITSATNISTITVNQPGTFNYTVTNTSNGCTTTGSQAVMQNTTAPAVSSSNSGSLSCTVLTSSVNATTTTTPVSYNWSGTGITSATNISTITVNQGGTFNYTVTNISNGCTTTGSQAVVQNTTAPVTVASTTGSITCVTNTVSLNSSLAGMNYTWTAPAGSSIASGTNLQNAVGQGTGTYTLSVINPANDCTYTTSIAAVQNTTTPTSVNAGPTQTLICGISTVTLTGSATPGTATANWLGGVASPNSFTTTAGSANVYTLQAINPATGCFITSTVQVLSSVGSPSATANAVTNSITCTTSSVGIGVTLTSAGPVTYQWSTPGISGSTTGASATATLAGVYTVTITNNPGNNCSVQINISVPSNTTPVVASVAAPSTITCNTPSVTLSASPVGSTYTYTWSGVAPVVSGGSTQNPIVDVGGNYSVAITNTVNGCVGTSTVFVPSNTVAPTASVAVSSVTTTCASPTVMLSASASPATNVNYSWTAPATGSLDDNTISNPVASGSGVFTVVVTNTVSGCSTAISQATVNVVADSNIPVVSLSANSLSITCADPTPSTAITTTSSPVSYSWTPTAGIVPGTETTANPQFSLAGTYSLVVTNTVSGCASNISGNVVNVVNDNTIPAISLSTGVNSGTLTCLNTSVVVTPTVTPANSNLTYTWSPSTGMSTPVNQASATFTNAGIYTLAVTNTLTGCVSSATSTANSFTVIADNATPSFTLGTASSVTTTCAAPNATLSASSDADPNSVYTWTSPSSATVTGNPMVFGTAGIYTVSVTNTLTGCSTASSVAQATVEIVADAGIPSATLTANSLSITCLYPTPTVTLSTTSSPVSYSWSPTSGIVPGTETTANPVFNTAGSYSVVVTNTVSGCASSNASNVVDVTLDNDTPVISLSSGANSGTLTCLVTSVSITPTITPASGNLTYTWSPAAGISTSINQASATFTDAGVYTLAVTNTLTGCVSTATGTANSFTVIANNSTPSFTLGTASSVTTTCAAPSATLSGSSDADPDAVYTWLTPSSTTITGNPIVVNAAGIYSVSVTNTITGCTTASTAAQATVEVVVGGGVPAVSLSVNSLSITCSNPTPSVAATTTDTPVSYSWSPATGISPGTETTDSPVFTAPGSYSVVVTNTISGCATSINSNVVDVALDNAVPTVTLYAGGITDGTVTCINPFVTADPSISPNNNNLTYTWSPVSGMSSSPNQAIATFTAANVYTLAITNTLTGCVSTATDVANTFTVYSNLNTPTVVATPISSNTVIGCGSNSSVTYSTNVVSPGSLLSYSWSTGATTSTISATTAGVYSVVVTDDESGCFATDQFTVTGSSTPPQNVDAGAFVSIPCGSNTVALNGTTTSTNVSYAWSGPSATSIVSGSNTVNPLVNEAGTYTFIVTDNLTGCQTSTTVAVSQGSVNISFTADPTSGISPLTVNFTNTSTGATSYGWDFGDGNTSTAQNPSNVFTASGSYIVTLISTSGCPGSYTVEIVVNDGLTLEIPNVFTPNNDNVNDVFTIKSTGIKEISLQIFNRWGEKLYEFSGAKASWDGLAPNGMKVPEGTYFYFVKATGFDDKEIEKQGTVNLFR
jgi:gliding motility-associated-like protein